MGDVFRQKAQLMEMSREMNKALRRKEIHFENKMASLREELKQSRVTSDQRLATADRMKQLMAEMQRKLETKKTEENVANAGETQFRLKYEQGQRQIDVLNKEIERLNRRVLMNNPAQSAQAGQAGQPRGMAEVQKQMESAQKALTARAGARGHEAPNGRKGREGSRV